MNENEVMNAVEAIEVPEMPEIPQKHEVNKLFVIGMSTAITLSIGGVIFGAKKLVKRIIEKKKAQKGE